MALYLGSKIILCVIFGHAGISTSELRPSFMAYSSSVAEGIFYSIRKKTNVTALAAAPCCLCVL